MQRCSGHLPGATWSSCPNNFSWPGPPGSCGELREQAGTILSVWPAGQPAHAGRAIGTQRLGTQRLRPSALSLRRPPTSMPPRRSSTTSCSRASSRSPGLSATSCSSALPRRRPVGFGGGRCADCCCRATGVTTAPRGLGVLLPSPGSSRVRPSTAATPVHAGCAHMVGLQRKRYALRACVLFAIIHMHGGTFSRPDATKLPRWRSPGGSRRLLLGGSCCGKAVGRLVFICLIRAVSSGSLRVLQGLVHARTCQKAHPVWSCSRHHSHPRANKPCTAQSTPPRGPGQQ